MTDQVFLDGRITLKGGDCLEVLKTLPDCSIESCVTDPPYHLTSIVKRFGGPNAAPAKHGTDGAFARASKGFMNRVWDGGDIAFRVELWAEVWRVLKPGGYVAAFSATRTYHRMACAIEDAGFDIRDDILNMLATDAVVGNFIDSLNEAQAEAFFKLMEESQFGGMAAWGYGSGFPKSHNVGKAIDRELGAKRETVRVTNVRNPKATGGGKDGAEGATRPWIEAALERGYHEKAGDDPATPQAAAWNSWGTALKPAWEPICLARKPLVGTVAANVLEHGTGALNIDATRVGTEGGTAFGRSADKSTTDSVGGYLNAKAGAPIDAGRWPANIVHDGSDEVVACFPDTASGGAPTAGNRNGLTHGEFAGRSLTNHGANSGSAARFFYTAKADKLDRIGSKHPTVKPVDLMQWLVRLVTPKGGLVLDPFAGSGSTGEAAWREGMRCILIEREEEYQADIAERLRLADKGPATRKARAIKQVANDNLPLFTTPAQAGAV
ncbi:site-specific DNA-methyltransferase [Mesorhizobium sp. BR1-1-13]|uniref:DNA-methyltransferase n=1 Tax=Mesorhizobium sp. BR1-1-13 TaxID=2876656 RepID=UPI001CD10149|nr:DNA methyltransferase [Mesorhizobium sp. BR1-1-13]MBZ9943462.1 site-specific DNA-methyltransferase [Mesorhizobium sp. BR1-1-13]